MHLRSHLFVYTSFIFCTITIKVSSAESQSQSDGKNVTQLLSLSQEIGEEADYENHNSLDPMESISSLQNALDSLRTINSNLTGGNTNGSDKNYGKETQATVAKTDSNSSTSLVTPQQRKERQVNTNNNFVKNITFSNENMTVKHYGTILKEQIPLDQRLQYFDALSDSMRTANRFQNEEDFQEFEQIFYWLMEQKQDFEQSLNAFHNKKQNISTPINNKNSNSSSTDSSYTNSTDSADSSSSSSSNNNSLPAWVKKIERKNLKRLLKYALNSDSENTNEGPVPVRVPVLVSPVRQPTDLPPPPCTKTNPTKWLGKEFYENFLAHTESEGYELLSEAIELRNVTLTSAQLLAIQCLYYNSFQGMQDDRAYIFSDFELDWDLRNTIFGTPIILSSIREIVESALNEEDSTPGRMSEDMVQMLSVFPSFRAKIEAEQKRKAVKYPTQFYRAVRKLQPHFYGIKKSNNFVDVESLDIIMSSAVSSLLESTGDQKKPNTTSVVFSFDNRLDWSHLQLLRLAGTQTFEKFHDFFSRMVIDKIRDVYNAGDGARRYVMKFGNTFSRIRMLPTGPLILVGCETLNTLMSDDPRADKNSILSAVQITKFSQLLQFLRGLYSQDDALINELPQQVQLLTDPNLNKHMKIMLKYAPQKTGETGTSTSNITSTSIDDQKDAATYDDDDNFHLAEVGILQESSGQKLPGPGDNRIVIVPLEKLGQYQNMTHYKNVWQFQLGYFRGYAEAWQDPVIKLNILLAGQTAGELFIGRRSGELQYNSVSSSNVNNNNNNNNSKTFNGTTSEALGDLTVPDGSSSFWDLFLFPDGQSFQLKWQGGLERFFSAVFDESGQIPIKLKATHFMFGQVPRDFKAAEFFVVPAEEYI